MKCLELVDVTATFYDVGDTENYDTLFELSEGLWCGTNPVIKEFWDALTDPDVDGGDGEFSFPIVCFELRPVGSPNRVDTTQSILEAQIEWEGTHDTFGESLIGLMPIAERARNQNEKPSTVVAVRFVAVFSIEYWGITDDDADIDISLLGELDFAKLEGAIVKVQA